MNIFARIIDWFLVRDYQVAKDKITRDVVGRYSRGNVRMQFGRYLTRGQLTKLRQEADKAFANLK